MLRLAQFHPVQYKQGHRLVHLHPDRSVYYATLMCSVSLRWLVLLGAAFLIVVKSFELSSNRAIPSCACKAQAGMQHTHPVE